MDPPQLRDDFYCSVLAYCYSFRVLAVGLNDKVYLWSEAYGVQFPHIVASDSDDAFVSSLSFSSTEGGHGILAIGRNNGEVSLWSLHDLEQPRFTRQHPSPVACVSFKPVGTRRRSARDGSFVPMEDLLVGDEAGIVYYYTIEWRSNTQVDIHGWPGAMNQAARIIVHSQQICGLAWSCDGEYFATGANDNDCYLFEAKDILKPPSRPPAEVGLGHGPLQDLATGFAMPYGLPLLLSPQLGSSIVYRNTSHPDSLTDFEDVIDVSQNLASQQGILEIRKGRQRHKWVHNAAIKAIAFCPWQRGLLATGGGSNDRAIHFYHTFSGACLATIDVQAQVTSLIWSTSRREIAATFGYAQPDHPYRIAVFSWPECRQVIAIPWANDMRALYAISYPGGPNEARKATREGETWFSRTADEGCIVVACSDESVKFQEVWTGARKLTAGYTGLLGGSDILEALEGIDKEGADTIR